MAHSGMIEVLVTVMPMRIATSRLRTDPMERRTLLVKWSDLRVPYPVEYMRWAVSKAMVIGHAAKPIRTQVHQSVRLLEVPHVWFLTATPLYNRAFDMCGYLAILSSSLCGADDINDADVDWFAQYKRLAEMDRLPTPPPYNLLQPKAFVSLFDKGHLMPWGAYWALPVMGMICLRRDMGDPVDVSDSSTLIGDEIPPMRIMSVDVRNSSSFSLEEGSEVPSRCYRVRGVLRQNSRDMRSFEAQSFRI